MSDLDKEPSNPHIPWKQLVTSFKEGGLTPAQYASFGMCPDPVLPCGMGQEES
jgi:hypothetical protein